MLFNPRFALISVKIVLLFLCFLFAFVNLNGQSVNSEISDFKDQIKLEGRQFRKLGLTKLDSFFLVKIMEANQQNRSNELTAFIRLRYGAELFNIKQFKQANAQIDTFFTIKGATEDSDYATAKGLKAMTFEELGLWEEADNLFNRKIELFKTIDPSKSLSYDYFLLGRTNWKQGDYQRAIERLIISKDLHEAEFPPNDMYICDPWFVLGNVYYEADSLSAAAFALQTAQSIAEYNEEAIMLATILMSKGNVYEKLKKPNSALKYYKIADSLYTNLVKENKEEQILYNYSTNKGNIALLHLQLNQIDFAEASILKSIQIKQESYGAQHHSLALAYEIYGDIEVAKGNHPNAIQHYQSALIQLIEEYQDTSIVSNPKLELGHCYSNKDLIRILDLKAQAANHLFLKNGDSKYLKLAFETYQVMDLWIQQFYRDLSSESSKRKWASRIQQNYANAIKTALTKKEYNTAFQFSEHAKAVSLWQNLSLSSALNVFSEKDSIRLTQLNVAIANAAFNYSQTKDKDDLETKQELEWEKEKLIKSYPTIHKQLYNDDFLNVRQVQQEIVNRHTALIEYFLSDQELYIFLITKDKFTVKSIPVDTSFINDIYSFSNHIQDRGFIGKAKRINKLGHGIFNKILAPALLDLDVAIDQLIVVPDKELNFIPFAALVTENIKENTFGHSSFVVNKYGINYLYSCNSYFQLQRGKAPNPEGYLGVAPIFSKNGKWSKLNKNESEITTGTNIWEGQSLIGQQATFKAVRSYIQQNKSGILHLATHADQTNQGGIIVFADDEEITQHKIQSLEWPVQQVILSACKTGDGKLSNGEGILSLGWSFAYKGVPSILMSQWQVDDSNTQKIMNAYNQHHHNGLLPSKALRQAQLEFLETADGYHLAPYFWAPFIHNGYFQSTQESSLKYWLFGLLFGGIILFFLRKMFQSKDQS